MTGFSKEKELSIIDLYLKGMSGKDIANLYGTYNTSIRRVLLRNNISIRGNSEVQCVVKENPFKNLCKDEVQYWLGYICADGNISKHPRNRINVASNLDPEHLKKYIEFVGYDLPMYKYFNKKYEVWEYSVNFSNKDIKEWIIDVVGITPAKSKDLYLKIPISFPLLRGVMDGDGTVLHVSDNNVSVFLFTASECFKEQILNFLVSNGIKVNVSKRKDNLFSISISGFNNVSLYYSLVYKNATVFLERKQLKFGSLIPKGLSDNPANSVKGLALPNAELAEELSSDASVEIIHGGPKAL